MRAVRTLEHIEKHKLVVALRTERPEDAYEAAMACIRGGLKLIEITFSVPGAEEVIGKLSGIEGVRVGAGTILTVSDLEKALSAGAKYIVSPHVDEELIRLTKAAGAVSIPGASTPTEIVRAHRAGGDIIKLFPFVEMGGLKFLKAVRGPLPFIKYMPSGGLTLENISEYLAAGVSGVILSSAIAREEFLRARDWAAIEERAAAFAQKITS